MPLRLVSLLLHLYVGWRVAPALGGAAESVAFSLLLAASWFTLPFGFGARHGGTRRFAKQLGWIGLVAMGLFSSLFVLSLVRDVTLLIAQALAHLWPGPLPLGGFAVATARAVPIAAVLVSLWGFANARRTARVRRVDVPLASLPPAVEGFTIAQISDLHVGPTIRQPYVEKVVEAVNALGADLVAITGDLIDGSVADLAEHVAPLAGLRSREGTFFVTGNHEYYSGAASWVHELRRIGIVPLMNEHVVVRRGAARIVVAGITDYSAGHFDVAEASDPKAALAGSPGDAGARILLAHQPRSAAAAEAAGFDLQLSGHTHGGQFWPWNHFVRLQQPFTAGLHRWRRMWVYTSRGTGYWGPPKRFGAPSEITLIRLVAAPSARPAPPGRVPRMAEAAAGG